MTKSTVMVNHEPLTVYVRDEADQSVAAEIFKLHEYRIAEEVIKTTTDAIVDGGAHSGMFTMYARKLNPTAPIFAVEPEDDNLKLFDRHLKENNINGVRVIVGALAKDYGKKKLVVTKDSHNHRLVLTDEKYEGKTQITQGYSLSKLIKEVPGGSIGLLKLDIEGGEYEVFAGATDEDFTHLKAIIMEYHSIQGHHYKQLEQQLREHGFGVQIFPSKFDRTMGFLWAKNKRQ